jgi:Tfp pilus assembly protein PilX
MLLDKPMKISSIHTKEGNKGYTLLFAVIVSVLVLSIAAFILSVSRKQAILSSSARDSIYAFYAADSGLECAIEHIGKLSDPTDNSTGYDITCGGGTEHVAKASTQVNGFSYGTSTFFMSTNGNYNSGNQNQSGISSCASTSVSYVQTAAAVTHTDSKGNVIVDSPPQYTVTVESRGYNIGWNGTNCNLTGPRKVERALRYIQG